LPDSILSGLFSSSADPHLAGDGPHESEELPRDRGDDDVGVFATAAQPPEPLAEPDLGLPGDVLDVLGELLDASANRFGDLGGMTVGPGAFDEDAAGVSGSDGAGSPRVEAADELVDVALTGADGADERDLRVAVLESVRDRDGVLMHVETDEKGGRLAHCWLPDEVGEWFDQRAALACRG
jgi:hypothetical protein